MILLATAICYTIFAYSQDSLLTYSRVLVADAVTKSDLFDKALIWCSKSFSESKSAINVKDKESGIIAGKGSINNYYKIPRKKDSVLCLFYTDYKFDWLIEIKEGKARFSLKNIIVTETEREYLASTSIIPPVKIMFQSPEKNQLIWALSKSSFIRYIDAITDNLNSDLKQKKDNW